ncbi:DinB family protein [Paenibacillus alkalitolerans]|uniref:DinB family protein n=1 Tax=Paenibacillus alkalitolerans TaxID=2799335 RepID=UPI0018F6F20C|nr:DinB family protein [Paenibacillus alkalitolerans]
MRQSLSQTDSELLYRYNLAPSKLEETLSNLSDSDLDRRRAEGKWTIREIAHHIIECDLNYFQINRYALANTGLTYFFNDFDPYIWNNNLEHKVRSLQLELQLFKLTREYITDLCKRLPNAMDRVLVHQNGRATVRDAIYHDNQHAYHHIEQILETRRLHNI